MVRSHKIILGLAGAAAFAFAAGGANAQQDKTVVVTGKDAAAIGEMNMISGQAAEDVAHACEKMAAAHGQSVAVVILDQFGNVVHEHRMDGAARYTAVHTAELKAHTALLTRRPTSRRQYNVQRNPNMMAREFGMGYFPTAGGLPIWKGHQIIGFIGVGGQRSTPQWNDELCGWTALNQVIGQQPPLPKPPARN